MEKIVIKSLKNWRGFELARSIKQCVRTTNKSLEERSLNSIVIKLTPDQKARGKVLFSYIINGFLLDPKDPIPNKHTNIWQSVKMAETFVELGYEVEVISWKNHTYIPKGEYSAFVDVRRNMERLAPLLNKDCVKITHLDTSHILFHNYAEAKRLFELQQRRGVTMHPLRYERPNLAIEYTDYATTCGNDATIKTFAYAGKKIFKIPSPCAVTYDWIENKDFEKTRKHFLWFSSSGLVHKGLDLVLDAFRDLPDYHLTICAPLDKDADFLEAYKYEISKNEHINMIGWVDIESKKFIDIFSQCIGVLHTSCSEGGAPAVKTCMHAGLIPIISYETSIDMEDFGVTLKSCSVEEIKNAIKYIANLSTDELKTRSYKAWEYARGHYTRENFAVKYKEVISQIMENNK